MIILMTVVHLPRIGYVLVSVTVNKAGLKKNYKDWISREVTYLSVVYTKLIGILLQTNFENMS